jgi:hypothetical protein
VAKRDDSQQLREYRATCIHGMTSQMRSRYAQAQYLTSNRRNPKAS